MKMTEQERSAMIRRSAYAWSCFQDNTPAEEILSQIYCDGLTDKSPRQGALMAGEVLGWMARFQQGYDAMLEDPEGYTGWLLSREMAPLLAENRLQALRQLMGMLDPARPEPPSASEEALRREAVKLLVNREDAAAVEQLLCAVPDGEPRNRRLVKTVCGEEMTLAVNTMVAYTMVKNGELGAGAARTASLGQVTAGVCAEDLLQSICQEERAGYLSPEQAAERRYAASAVCRVMLLLAGAAAAGGLAMLATEGAVLTAGMALLAALGSIMAEKYRLDRQMVEECAEDLTAPVVALPQPDSWQGRQAAAPLHQSPLEPVDEDQEDSEEMPLTLF